MPFTIHSALVAALAFLSFEELPKKERPPRSIWLNGERMKQWWKDVERMRKDEMEGHGADEPPMARNALKSRLLVGFDDA